MKLSQDKVTYPYCKQVWREISPGKFLGDVIGVEWMKPTCRACPCSFR